MAETYIPISQWQAMETFFSMLYVIILVYRLVPGRLVARSAPLMSLPSNPVDEIQRLIYDFDTKPVVHFDGNRYFASCGNTTVQQTFSLVMISPNIQNLLA